MIVPEHQKAVSAAEVGLIEELARRRSQVERLRGALRVSVAYMAAAADAFSSETMRQQAEAARSALAETGGAS